MHPNCQSVISPTRDSLLGLQAPGWSLLKVPAASHPPLVPQPVCDPSDVRPEPTALPAREMQTPAVSRHHAGEQTLSPRGVNFGLGNLQVENTLR